MALHDFTPKLASMLAEGYGWARLRQDASAGLTVAIVALPLSMAIAVGSGVTPERGLYAAIVGGFLVSALGGSRFQIGGPAGAFIVLVAATAARFGLSGLLLTTAMSGAMLILIGALGLGRHIRHVPHTVVVGFTAGIAVTIFVSQLADLTGIGSGATHAHGVAAQFVATARNWPETDLTALGLGLGVVAAVVAIRRWRPAWPSLLIAVAGATVVAAGLHLPVETIGRRFGGVPSGLPMPRLPEWDMGLVLALLPSAVSFTLLGAVESLLSAVVADEMGGARHRPNIELIAQGVANVGSALFGGLVVTGTIARTATNVRAGATSPVAGMAHAVFLLIFLLVAAPLANFVPLAALAGMLAVIAWNMIDWRDLRCLLGNWRSAAVVLATFGLTVARDLTAGILTGSAVALIFWAEHRLRAARTAA